MLRKKNYTLEVFKFIASYMVVFIHIRFTGDVGMSVNALARFAVPFFFLISGFYSYGCTYEKILKRIKNILGLIILAVLAYAFYESFIMLLNHNYTGIADYFKAYINIGKLRNLAIFNLPIHKSHLWYLFAILYVYIIYFFVVLFKIKEKLVFAVAILLLLAHLALGEICAMLGNATTTHYIRNFALMGLPFFGIGLMVNKYKEKIVKTPKIILFVFAVIGAVESVVSCKLFGFSELYVGSLLLLYVVVALSFKYTDKKYPNAIIKLAECSTNIYIFHIMVYSFIVFVCSKLEINYKTPVSKNILPFAVCILTTLLSLVLNEITRVLKSKSKNKQKAR